MIVWARILRTHRVKASELQYRSRVSSRGLWRYREAWVRQIFIAILGVASLASPTNADWGFRKSITIDRTKVGASGTSQSTISDFPMLIHVTDNDLRTVANGGEVTDSSGDDIAFGALDTTTCGGLSGCAFYHEIESYSPTTGELVAWVRVTSINTNAAASDTVIYIYYGNSDISSPLESPDDVWDSDFKGVWHLHDDFLDSTSNGNDGTNNGSSTATGVIADGQDFDGTNDYIQTTSDELETADDMTISLWFNADDTSYAHHLVWQGDADGNGWGETSPEQEMHLTLGSNDGSPVDDRVSAFLGDTDIGNDSDVLQVDTAFTDTSNSHHLVAVIQNLGSSPEIELFLDGVSVGTDTGTTTRTSRSNWDTDLRFGRPGLSTRYLDGLLDEVRISTIARDEDWIVTECNTVDDPGDVGSPGFYTLGSEEADPPTAVRGLTATVRHSAIGTDIQWRTDSEVDNLGFHVDRERGSRITRLTQVVVPGSALRVGASTRLVSGGAYRWNDPNGELTDRYWVESIDLGGATQRHGPFPVTQRARGFVSPPPMHSPLSRVGPAATSTGVAAWPGVSVSWETPGLTKAEVQHALAAAPALQLRIREDGWIRVLGSELLAAGLPVGVDPRRLQLYVDGTQVSILITGDDDGRVDPQDTVEFWGVGHDSPWSRARVYWLVEGSEPGARVPIRERLGSKTPHNRSGSRSWYSVDVTPRSIYFPALINGDVENFFGPPVSTTPIDLEVVAPFVDRSGPHVARLEVQLQGVTTVDHAVRVQLNGSDVGYVDFQGRGLGSETFLVPNSLLSTDTNSVSLVAEGGAGDFSFVDRIRLSYWRQSVAIDDVHHFNAKGATDIRVVGFSSPLIQVADVTDPLHPELLVPRVSFAKARHSASIRLLRPGTRSLYAFEFEHAAAPVEIRPNRPSLWHCETAGARVVAVTHRDFWESALRWKTYRSRQGWSVAMVDVADLYDEYSFGTVDPRAIRGFLEHARRTWDEAPTHVVLFGDGTLDPRGHISDGAQWIPTWMTATENLETAADDGYVDFDLDGRPECAIGRIPARTPSQLEAVIDKIIAFEGSDRSWSALLVADSNDSVFDFELALTELEAAYPVAVSLEFLLRGQSSTPTEDLISGLRRSPTLLNYIGHGSRTSWGGTLLQGLDAASLPSNSAPTLMLSMACLTGYFHDPFEPCLAETFLAQPGAGAVAIWASSGMTRIRDQRLANLALLDALFAVEPVTLGEAIRAAKRGITDPDVRRSWNLLGDPLLRLPRQTRP